MIERPERLSEMLRVSVTPSTKARMEEACRKYNVKMPELLRQVIAEFLDNESSQQKN